MSEPPVPQAQQPLAMKKAKKRPRLVVHETVFHQSPGGSPTSSTTKFLRWLATDEQPFIRHFTASPDWTALECGWLPSASMLVLSNEGEAADPAIELGLLIAIESVPAGQRTMHSPPKVAPFVVPFTRLLPSATTPVGSSLRFPPVELATLRVRSTGVPVKCILRLTPE